METGDAISSKQDMPMIFQERVLTVHCKKRESKNAALLTSCLLQQTDTKAYECKASIIILLMNKKSKVAHA